MAAYVTRSDRAGF